MKLQGITYKNQTIDDESTFRQLPEILQRFLKQLNGVVAFKGGLHIRGCTSNPSWHSINHVWSGKLAFWKHYPDILDTDVPFGQDCMGDQFLLRGEKVIKLYAETGDVQDLNLNFVAFLDEIENDPVEFLGMFPLVHFEMDGKELQPGQLLQADPPLSLNPSGNNIFLKAIPVEEQLLFLSEFYKRRKRTEEGNDFVFLVE